MAADADKDAEKDGKKDKKEADKDGDKKDDKLDPNMQIALNLHRCKVSKCDDEFHSAHH